MKWITVDEGRLLELIGEYGLPPWKDADGTLLGGGIDCAPLAAEIVERVRGLAEIPEPDGRRLTFSYVRLPVPDFMAKGLNEVHIERTRQVAKWGTQRHPSVPPYLLEHRASRVMIIREDMRAQADRAKHLVDADAETGVSSWLHILEKEFHEMRAEAWAGNPLALREELIQLAAVALSWVETLDDPTDDQGAGT